MNSETHVRLPSLGVLCQEDKQTEQLTFMESKALGVPKGQQEIDFTLKACTKISHTQDLGQKQYFERRQPDLSVGLVESPRKAVSGCGLPWE